MTATMTAPRPSPSQARVGTHDLMAVSFAISPRGAHQDIPEQDARHVSEMRRLARERLNYCGLSALADDVELLVSELVTNAIEHSHGAGITVTLRLDEGLLLLYVKDQTALRPHVQKPAADAEHGRGLLIVKALADSWGVSTDGTTVWCALTF